MACEQCGQPGESCTCVQARDLIGFLSTFNGSPRAAEFARPPAGDRLSEPAPVLEPIPFHAHLPSLTRPAGTDPGLYPPPPPAPPPPPPAPPPPGVALGETSPFGFPPPPAASAAVPAAEPWRSVAATPSGLPGPAPSDPALLPSLPADPRLTAGVPPPPPAYPDPRSQPANGLATTSLVLGLCSLLVPLLSIPGAILGVVSLRQIKRRRLQAGRARSIAGLTASLVLGPLVALTLILLLTHGSNRENPGQVETAVRAAIESTVQSRTGVSVNVSVTCPKNEPRRAGTVFSCRVSVSDRQAPVQVQIRETDNRGGVLIEGVSPQRTGSQAASPAA